MKQAILLATLFLLGAASAWAQTAPTQTPNAINASVSSTPVPPAKIAAAKPGFPLTTERANPVRIPRLEKPPVIDGKLDAGEWQGAAQFKDFFQTDPGYNVAASEPTEVFMGYDPHTLYIAFHCYDEPGKVRATVPKRDDVFADDTIRVLLDTYNDQRKAYVLTFNPLGVQEDGIRTEGSGVDWK